MLLAIDAGNTNIVFAVCDGSRIVKSWRCETTGFTPEKFSMDGVNKGTIEAAIVSSVIPSADSVLRNLCEEKLGMTPVFITGRKAA